MVDASARIHPTAIIEEGVTIGAGTAVWDNVHARAGARVGRDCIIGEKTYLAPDVVVADRCKLNAMVYVCTGVTIEQGVMVAANVTFTNDRFPARPPRSSTRCGRAISRTRYCRRSCKREPPSAPARRSATTS